MNSARNLILVAAPMQEKRQQSWKSHGSAYLPTECRL